MLSVNLSKIQFKLINPFIDPDGINWTPVNAGSSRVPSIENGLYVYHVDTVLVPAKADSATFYRVKVGTTTDNLDNPNCSVYNSQ